MSKFVISQYFDNSCAVLFTTQVFVVTGGRAYEFESTSQVKLPVHNIHLFSVISIFSKVFFIWDNSSLKKKVALLWHKVRCVGKRQSLFIHLGSWVSFQKKLWSLFGSNVSYRYHSVCCLDSSALKVQVHLFLFCTRMSHPPHFCCCLFKRWLVT